MIELKSPAQLEHMRQAGRVVGAVLEMFQEVVEPGMTTWDLDQLAKEKIVGMGAIPAFKGYQGFPGHVCASVNEEVVHGIPSKKRVLEAGDIIGLDVGSIVDGYYGDGAVTVAVGEISETSQRLMQVTQDALQAGIERAVEGNHLSDISHAIEQAIVPSGFSIVKDFVGHGIGTQLHEAPQIPNYGKPGFGPELKVGMVLAIEPMVNEGEAGVKILSDGWTAVTSDRKRSAHFEHTVAVGKEKPEVLTLWQKKKQSK